MGSLANEPNWKKSTTFSKASLHNMLSVFYFGTVAISHENSWDFSLQKMAMPVTVSRKKKKKRTGVGGAKWSKVWIFFPSAWSFQMQMYMHKNACLELLVSRNVYNTFMLSSKQMISYLHDKLRHRVVIAIIGSWKIVGINQEINAIYPKISRPLC